MVKPPLSHRHAYQVVVLGIVFFIAALGVQRSTRISPISRELLPAIATVSDQIFQETPPPVVNFVAPHIATPTEVRGLYLTGYSAGSAKTRKRIIDLIGTTSANSVVIDIKDATGRLSYMPGDLELAATGVGTARISNLSSVIREFHSKGIYVIGRLQVFEDPYRAVTNPEDAYTSIASGGTWTNYKGRAWLRADSTPVWDYTVRIARDAYEQGFDEINLDYVRFPSDGVLADIDHSTQTKGRADTLTEFFAYMDQELRQTSRIPLSADLFGLTMSARGDLGIGQILERVAPHVDAIAPMVYPSHFAVGTYGIPNPAAAPYDIIKKSLGDGSAKLAAIGELATKLRPWLQDFDMGATYTTEMIQDQIRAADELGITSWMLWDPRNQYTRGGF